MPEWCTVPLCKGTGGHKFPDDELEIKKWLVAMRRQAYKPTKYSRVCRQHFTEQDYDMPHETIREIPRPFLKKGAVPSRFKWTEPNYDTRNDRRIEQLAHKDRNKKQVSDEHSKKYCERQILLMDAKRNVEVEVKPEPEIVGLSVAIQCNLCNCRNSYNLLPSTIKKHITKQLVIERLIDVNSVEEIQFYTGFEDYKSITDMFQLLGEEVSNLEYYPDMKPHPSPDLRPCDEFLMILIKLHRNVLFIEFAVRTKIKKAILCNIFITWVNYLYFKFKDLNLWTLTTITHLRDDKNSCKIVIECTEIKIQKPKDEAMQESTYSTTKSCHTLKVLVGISADGCVVFVSDAFGGSISNRELFIRSGLMDILEPNSIIQCNRKFDIQDLVSDKDIRVEMPAFLNKGQSRDKTSITTPTDIERVIGLCKTCKILSSTMISKLVPFANRIIFVCYMLVNFRNSGNTNMYE